MNKKLLVSVLLCFFVLVLGMLAQEKKEEKGKIIEHLVWADTGHQVAWELEITNPAVRTPFFQDSILTFHVPASPKSDILFIEGWSQAQVKWSDYEIRNTFVIVWFEFISDVIPDGIWIGSGITNPTVYETNNAHDYDLQYMTRRLRRYNKVIMRRNSIDSWTVKYEETWEDVPEEDAVRIINNLIDNGFDVKVDIDGHTQGADYVSFWNIVFEVTRLSKK